MQGVPEHSPGEIRNVDLERRWTQRVAEIDAGRAVYLFTHGRADLREAAVAALKAEGFHEDRIVDAAPTSVGDVGDYMAMLWMPPNPDHIKIQVITKVEPAEPEGMIGLWKGVSKDDLFTVKIS